MGGSYSFHGWQGGGGGKGGGAQEIEDDMISPGPTRGVRLLSLISYETSFITASPPLRSPLLRTNAHDRPFRPPRAPSHPTRRGGGDRPPLLGQVLRHDAVVNDNRALSRGVPSSLCRVHDHGRRGSGMGWGVRWLCNSVRHLGGGDSRLMTCACVGIPSGRGT